MNQSLSDALEPIAAAFRGLGTPEPIVHWGHPVTVKVVVVGTLIGPSSPPRFFSQLKSPNANKIVNSFFIILDLRLMKLLFRYLCLLSYDLKFFDS